ncbi:MAG: helix-turn-helix transcriptional regulator, partial [Chloroflexi bacterium]|nr:helix-turn-helix transcriptional regulator [Chloroflexota bacterium]
DVPLEQIARRAGVGIATLYRRFPTRDELLSAVFEDRLVRLAALAAEARRAPDARTGFRRYLERACAMQAADRGLGELLIRSFPGGRRLQDLRQRAERDLAEVIRRAQAEGRLRSDLVVEDVTLLLMANAGVLRATRTDAPRAWRRFLALMLDACDADRARPLPAPPRSAQLSRALRRLSAP